MQWNIKKTIDIARRWNALSEWSVLCIVAIATLATFWLPVTHAEEADTLLRWQNGDTLPGRLQESNSATLRWASPHFLDDLMVDVNVLDSVIFRKTPNPATETFRVSTISGDVWVADLIGADDNTFLFSSQRHGQFRVKRSAVWKFERRDDSNQIFDGSQLQQVDLSKPHVHTTDGQIFQGELFVQQDSTYVLDIDGTRHTIDGQQVSRVIQSGPSSTASDGRAGRPSAYVKYHDKTVLHGKITHINADSVVLQTDFADDPVTCSLAGATRLHFDTNSKTNQTVQNKDRLFHAYGSLRGSVLFSENRGPSLVEWKSLGAIRPVRLANNTAAHITRAFQSTSPLRHFDTVQFPHALHLQTGETFPCHITAYDGKGVSFQSPFVSAQHLDPVNMKALEFSDRTHATSIENIDKTQPAINFESFRVTARGNGVVKMQLELVGKKKDGAKFIIDATDKVKLIDGNPAIIINEINAEAQPQAWMEIVPKDMKGLMALSADEWFGVMATPTDPDKDKPDPQLERALTVPRFNSNNPPNHILVANTDDIIRGQFLDFNGQTLQFDSKLRRFSVPIARVARVVDVSSRKAPPHENSGSLTPDTSPHPVATPSKIRVTLIDGSTLIFQPLEIKDGKLIGRSSVYGEVSLPTSSIKYLHFGEKAKSFKAAFEKWVVHPAKTP